MTKVSKDHIFLATARCAFSTRSGQSRLTAFLPFARSIGAITQSHRFDASFSRRTTKLDEHVRRLLDIMAHVRAAELGSTLKDQHHKLFDGAFG
jgi:hypothetical protein